MKLRLRYLTEDISRHGQVRYYVCRPGKPKIRIRHSSDDPEFMVAYFAALVGNDLAGAPKKGAAPAKDTFRGLCLDYMASGDFKRLTARSQGRVRGILESCCAEPLKPGSESTFGECPLSEFGPKHVRALRDRKFDLPGAANNRVKNIRRLFSWAGVAEPDLKNPATKVDRFTIDSTGFHHWSLAEVTKYERRHPIGTKARLALDLMLYTGARRSDAVRIGPGDVDDEGWLVFKQAKTGGEVAIPIIPTLVETLAAGPVGDEFFLETAAGLPFSAAGFGNKFREWCDQAGLKECSAHGLRKVMSARLAELGCSDREIMAITGHAGEREVSRYTEGARRRILAASAMDKLKAALSHAAKKNLPPHSPT